MESCHFFDIEVSLKKEKFVTTAYSKSTFSGADTDFESFLSAVYKFGMIYTLAYRCFKICSDRTKFLEELSFFKKMVTLCHLSFLIYANDIKDPPKSLDLVMFADDTNLFYSHKNIKNLFYAINLENTSMV